MAQQHSVQCQILSFLRTIWGTDGSVRYWLFGGFFVRILLDHLSVYEWIEQYVEGGHNSPMGRMLDGGCTGLYGIDTDQQSSLNDWIAGMRWWERLQSMCMLAVYTKVKQQEDSKLADAEDKHCGKHVG